MKIRYIVFIIVAILLAVFFIDANKTLLTAGEINLESPVPDWYQKKTGESFNEADFQKLTPKRFDPISYKYYERSPDGEKIVFVARRYGCEHIWLMDSNGHNKVQLTKNGCHSEPAWNPGGNKIVYRVFSGPDEGVYSINLREKSKLKAIIDGEMEFSRVTIYTLSLIIILTILFTLYSYRILSFKLFKVTVIICILSYILFSGILIEYITFFDHNFGVTSPLALLVIILVPIISSILYRKRKIFLSSMILIYIGTFLFILWNVLLFIFLKLLAT